MHSDIMDSVKETLPTESEKNLLAEVETKYAALHRQLEASFADKEKQLIDDLSARHMAECRRLQEQSAAGEKALLAELEGSFVAKEEKLMKELRAGHAAECLQLKEAAAEKEQALLDELASARQQLFAVILVALLSIAVIWNFKAGTKAGVQPVPSVSSGSGQVAAPAAPPATFVIEANVLVPATAPQVSSEAPAAVKKGNGGNFSGGKSSVRVP